MIDLPKTPATRIAIDMRPLSDHSQGMNRMSLGSFVLDPGKIMRLIKKTGTIR
jgi:hypothetical protein